jgi:polyisoprenoid-binding protein YceI
MESRRKSTAGVRGATMPEAAHNDQDLMHEEVSVSYPPVGTYDVDPHHTTAEFVARHMLTKVRGRFPELSGTVEIAETPEESHAEVELNTATLSTGSEMRDQHLRTSDFFETEQYPAITFRSTGVRVTGDTTFELDGELTVRGITRPLTLTGEFLGWGNDPWGKTRLFAEAKATGLDREQWGLTWNKAAEVTGVLIAKRVDIEFQVQAVLRG